ncbi:phosphate system positive regulatory protein pho81 [Coemansia umbellata]|nr:phosphate system positive regulatory protein pho81 [Coemansia umbellata]
MKFGKHIQAHTIPEWAVHYMNYKGLKKIINELSAPLTPGLNSSEAAKQRLQTVKAAFFFQVDRELEKVNSFYLQKEADAKVRLKSLIEKQRNLRSRGPRNRTATIRALREAFLNSRHDLDKLQNFVEINGTGFRKILKKWDKRSKSSIKELYLARQVEVQPCFNQGVIAELSDTVTKCLSELEHALEEETELANFTSMPSQLDLIAPPSLHATLHVQTESTFATNELQSTREQSPLLPISQQTLSELDELTADQRTLGMRRSSTGFLFDHNLSNSVQIDRTEAELFQALLKEPPQPAVELLGKYKSQKSAVQMACVTRVLWRACSEIKVPEKQQLLLDSGLADLRSTDDINERTLVHEAAIHGSLLVLKAAVAIGCNADDPDYYGRRAIHYAAINGHEDCIKYLLELGCKVDAVDDDGNNAFEYAIINSKTEATKLLLQHDPAIASNTPEHPVLVLACEKGHKDIVLMLLESGAEICANLQGIHPAHVAARSGFAGILQLLLEDGNSANILDKDLGWTPIFYAASEGHIECIRVLLDAGCDVDVVDEVGHTPAYYASYEGHLRCANLLLDAAERNGLELKNSRMQVQGSITKFTATSGIAPFVPEASRKTQEEFGSALGDGELQASSTSSALPNTNDAAPPSSANNAEEMTDLDLDGIPSLSLPPPLIPFRVYGHNFLGKRTRIQIRMLADSRTGGPPISFLDDRDMFSLKLVAIAKPDAGMVPYTIMLPLETPSMTFGFQADDPNQFRLEFMLYPSFGLQPIGKAVALPSLFSSASRGIARLPLLDRYLKLVAEVRFEYLVIRPFTEAQLQIGGKVETYWKSTNPGPRPNASSASASTLLPGFSTQSPKLTLSTGLSNTPLSGAIIGSPISIAESVGGNQGLSSTPLVVSSSLAAEHVCVQVQVCKDGVPVVTPWMRIGSGGQCNVNLQVSSLTHEEFQKIMRLPATIHSDSQDIGSNSLSNSQGLRPISKPDTITGTAEEWHQYVLDGAFTLKEALELLPARFGISIQVLCDEPIASNSGASMENPAPRHDVNSYIDSILRTVYADSQKNTGGNNVDGTADRIANDRPHRDSSQQRNTIFCSYSPTVCNALNWKQPNYPVFLLTSGYDSRDVKWSERSVLESTNGRMEVVMDAPMAGPIPYYLSLKEAIRFACTNNLLGIMCDSSLLIRVPELIKNIKGNGLFLISFDHDNKQEQLCATQKVNGVDALMSGGVIRYEPDENTEYAI